MNSMCLRFVGFSVAFLGCADVAPPADGPDDSFLAAAGKSDTGGIAPDGPAACGVVYLANNATREVLATPFPDGVGLSPRAVDNILYAQLGDDGIEGTTDDQSFTDLYLLDAVPFIGPLAFEKLLTYAKAEGYATEECTPCRHRNWQGRRVGIATVGMPTSIAGSPGRLHAAYQGEGGLSFAYGFRNPGWEWTTSTAADRSHMVDEAGRVGTSSALVVDDEGRSYIAYQDRENDRLKLAISTPASPFPDNDYDSGLHAVWETSVVEEAEGTGFTPAVALGESGGIYIVYGNESSGSLRLASREAGAEAWRFEDVDTEVSLGTGFSIAVSQDRVYVAYRGFASTLRVAHRDSGGPFTVTEVDEHGGYGPDIAVDRLGGVHVSYAAVDTSSTPWRESVRYAHRPPDARPADWSVRPLEDLEEGASGRPTSMVLDQAGTPWIAYSDGPTNSTITVARRELGGGFILEPLPRDVAGTNVSLTLNPASGPFQTLHVFYFANSSYFHSFLGCSFAL